MWPLLLDMQTAECKKALRTLELEAYTSIVSAFRAQGDLSTKKLEILKDLQTIFRHKAELRRATNDERLFTIAKRLSHGQEVSSQWLKQCKRQIPLLPSFRLHSDQSTDSESNNGSVADRAPSERYRILADQILSKLQPTLGFYKSQNDENEQQEACIDENEAAKMNGFSNDDENMITDEDEKNLVYLKNGYVVEANSVSIENMKSSEYIKKAYSENEENSSTFMKSLIKRFRQQQEEKERRSRLEEEQEKKAEEEAAALAAAQRLKAAAAAVVNQHAAQSLAADPSKYYTKLVLNNDYITLIKNNQTSTTTSHQLIDHNHIIEQPTTTIKLAPTNPTSTTNSTPIQTHHHQHHHHHHQQAPQMIKLTTLQLNNNQPIEAAKPTHIRLTSDGLKPATTNPATSNQKLIYLPTSPATTPAAVKTTAPQIEAVSSPAPNLIQKLVLYKKPSPTLSTQPPAVLTTQTLASPTTGILKPVCDDTFSSAALSALAQPANENLIRTITATNTIASPVIAPPANIKLSFNQQFLNLPQTSVSIGKQILLNVPSNTNNSTTTNNSVTTTTLKPQLNQLQLKYE